MSVALVNFVARWKLRFLISFFLSFRLQRDVINMFYFTLTIFVLLSSKYFVQSFSCVTTLRNVDTKLKHFDFFEKK